jgi:hypothetical protein
MSNFDTLLLFGVGGCNLALAWMGFHVSRPQGSRRFEIAFVLVGLLGLILNNQRRSNKQGDEQQFWRIRQENRYTFTKVGHAGS